MFWCVRRCDVPDGALPTNYPDPDPDFSGWNTGVTNNRTGPY